LSFATKLAELNTVCENPLNNIVKTNNGTRIIASTTAPNTPQVRMICPSLCNLFDYTIASVTRGSDSMIHSPAEKIYQYVAW
jgi:hypothetical protein